MKQAAIFGVFTALLGLAGFIYVLTAGSDVAVMLLPYEAFQGLAFFWVWGAGFPIVLGYLAAGFCLIAVLLLGFAIGYKLWCWMFYNK